MQEYRSKFAELTIPLVAARIFCSGSAVLFMFQFSRHVLAVGLANQAASFCYFLATLLVLLGLTSRSGPRRSEAFLFAGLFGGLGFQSCAQVCLLLRGESSLGLVALYLLLTTAYAFLAVRILNT